MVVVTVVKGVFTWSELQHGVGRGAAFSADGNYALACKPHDTKDAVLISRQQRLPLSAAS